MVCETGYSALLNASWLKISFLAPEEDMDFIVCCVEEYQENGSFAGTLSRRGSMSTTASDSKRALMNWGRVNERMQALAAKTGKVRPIRRKEALKRRYKTLREDEEPNLMFYLYLQRTHSK